MDNAAGDITDIFANLDRALPNPEKANHRFSDIVLFFEPHHRVDRNSVGAGF